jgi:hypothetical protein
VRSWQEIAENRGMENRSREERRAESGETYSHDLVEAKNCAALFGDLAEALEEFHLGHDEAGVADNLRRYQPKE